jgi:murein DD-endopeptidase MepM/ murein hydrolase activator NlpD
VANLPLGFAGLAFGGVLIVAGITGGTFADILAGKAHIPAGGGTGPSGGGQPTTSAGTGAPPTAGVPTNPVSGLLSGKVRANPDAPGTVAPDAFTSIGGLHDTLGLAGYPAHDYFAPAGSAVFSPVSGKVVKLSGSDPNVPAGSVTPGGAYGLSVYVQGANGTTYFLTHLGGYAKGLAVGSTVSAGQVIGSVADWLRASNGVTPDHIHMGIHL